MNYALGGFVGLCLGFASFWLIYLGVKPTLVSRAEYELDRALRSDPTVGPAFNTPAGAAILGAAKVALRNTINSELP